MKYIAKEECYFDADTEVELTREVHPELFWDKGYWSTCLIGLEKPEVLYITRVISVDELEGEE